MNEEESEEKSIYVSELESDSAYEITEKKWLFGSDNEDDENRCRFLAWRHQYDLKNDSMSFFYSHNGEIRFSRLDIEDEDEKKEDVLNSISSINSFDFFMCGSKALISSIPFDEDSVSHRLMIYDTEVKEEKDKVISLPDMQCSNLAHVKRMNTGKWIVGENEKLVHLFSENMRKTNTINLGIVRKISAVHDVSYLSQSSPLVSISTIKNQSAVWNHTAYNSICFYDSRVPGDKPQLFIYNKHSCHDLLVDEIFHIFYSFSPESYYPIEEWDLRFLKKKNPYPLTHSVPLHSHKTASGANHCQMDAKSHLWAVSNRKSFTSFSLSLFC